MNDQVRTGVLQWDPARGRLVIAEDGGATRPVPKPERDLTGDLHGQQLAGLHGVAVDYNWHAGQARAIRRAGNPAPERQSRRPEPPDPDAFHNPYTFIPAAPRDGAPADLADNKERGPAGHQRLRPGLWTGRIAVTLTVETPLLLLDTSRRQSAGGQDHYTYPVLTRDGAPHLPATSVKGMLRSAYEAVTNSRFGIFDKHTDRLGYRMSASDARQMVPARISDDGTELQLLPGDTEPSGQLRPNPILHAAWLPRYGQPTGCRAHPAGWEPSHGEEVLAYVELFQHYRRVKGALVTDFQLWRVRSLSPVDADPMPLPSAAAPPRPGVRYVPVTGEALRLIRGHVCVTNRNIGGKHDERIFFEGRQPARTQALSRELRTQWEDVIRNYRSAHADREIHRIRDGQHVPPSEYTGPDPGQTAWSPHQYDDHYLRLNPAQLCYALIGGGGKVLGLYPVMISRGLFPAPPRSLLPDSLRPAETLDQLSPADRVFGWTRAGGAGGYRGQLRIGPVTCDQGNAAIHDDPADFGEHGVPLAILGRPRPQQARFYLAARRASPQQPLRDGLHKDQWYRDSQGLRGRKVYPHHAGLANDYWDQPVQDRTQERDSASRYQEYRRPREGPKTGDLTPDKDAFLIPDEAGEQRNDQNRSVRGWVRPHSTFRFTIEVKNVSDVELGALAWLLHMPPGHFHRLGYGKPLGFGSVRLDIDQADTDLRRGEDWVSHYRSLRPTSQVPDGNQADGVLDAAIASFTSVAGRDSKNGPASPLTAFLAAARGDPSAPVHYPRVRPAEMNPDVPVPPDPRGRSFEWFRQNEKERRGQVIDGRGCSLPTPGNGSLTVYPAEKMRADSEPGRARDWRHR